MLAEILLVAASIQAQGTGRWLGTVSSVNAQQLVIKTDSGTMILVELPATVSAKKIAPQERDLSHAQEITVSDIVIGDRVLVRGTQEGSSVTAQSLVLMTARDITKKNEQEQQAWRDRSTLGVVKQVNDAAGEVLITTRGTAGLAPLTVVIKPGTELRRYPPDSVRYADTVPSKISEIKEGDQLRALGAKDETGTRLVSDKVVFGSFHTLAGTITQAATAGSPLQLKNLQNGKLWTIYIKPTTQMKKMGALPPGMGGAPQGNAAGSGNWSGRQGGQSQGSADGRPSGSGNGRPGNQSQGSADASASGSGRPSGNWGGRPQGDASGSAAASGGPSGNGGNRQGAVSDLSRMLERMQDATIDDLKVGEMVMLSCVPGVTPNECTAVVLVAGVESLIDQLRPSGSSASGPDLGGTDVGGAMDSMLSMPSQ